MATPQVVAHRGASRAARENTLDAFDLAGKLGADGIELDVRRTADGLMAIHHDPALADGRLICEMNASELPAHVPLLSDALDACGDLWVNIEIKNHPDDPDHDPRETLAAAVAHHLAERGDDDRWLVSSFSRATIDAMRTLRPQVRTGFLTVGVRPDALDKTARDLAVSGHSALHPYDQLLTPECVRAFHAQGIEVNVWTVDDPARMAELVSWGVDSIITNVPDICRSAVS